MTTRIATVRIKPERLPIHLDRDRARGWPCTYCWRPMIGSRFPTYDHVVPRSKGGPDARENMIVVCFSCNQDKADLSLPAFIGMLMARADPRAVTVRAFLDWVIAGTGDDPEFQAICFGEIGAAYASHRVMRKPRLSRAA